MRVNEEVCSVVAAVLVTIGVSHLERSMTDSKAKYVGNRVYQTSATLVSLCHASDTQV